VESTSALSTTVTDAVRTTNGYQKTGDLITLPYTSTAFITQSYASTTVNLNPYDTIPYVGELVLNPEIDEWMETERQPDMLIDLPGPFDTITELNNAGIIDLNLGTVWNNWNDNWSGNRVDTNTWQTEVSQTGNDGWGRQRSTMANWTESGTRTRSGIRTTMVPRTIQQSFGDRVLNVAFASFIRQKSITFTADAMKPDTRVYPFFDGIDVSTYVTPTGSTAGAALTTDSNGSCSGSFAIPDPTDDSKPRWRTGKRAFRLTSNSTNSLTGDVFTSAETDYTAKGLLQQVQATVTSTREAQITRTTQQESTNITRGGTRVVSTRNWQFSPPNDRPDPVAQAFLVDDSVPGIFVTSIDVYFSAKDSVQPVTMQLRTMTNGYPTTTVIPFGQITKAAADISTSTDASVATTFTFPSPVFLQSGTEYCFVMPCQTENYTIYTARMGQKTLDGSRLISKQPILSSMFKSQNGGTWTAEQNENVKFALNRAAFTENTYGYVYLVNDELPVLSLKKNNPITTTSGSAVITVNHRNHGMHSTSNNVTIAGVASGDHNGIAHSSINRTFTTIGNIKLDSYTVTAYDGSSNDTASSSGDIGSTTVTATRNILYDVIQPIIGVVQPPATTLTATMRTTGGRTLEASETEFGLDATSKKKNVTLNEDYHMTSPGMVASAINETNEMSSSKSFTATLTLWTPTGLDTLSPVIDTKRMSLILIQNRLNNPVSGTTPDYTAETANTGGSASAKYITKPVTLENASTALDIRITANVRSTSTVALYYRTTGAEDVRKLGDVAWTAFNSDGTTDSGVAPSKDDFNFKEHKWSASSIPAFTAFQLKVVMTGTNSAYPPKLKDMRGIALAV
jgi:hypothetical protein